MAPVTQTPEFNRRVFVERLHENLTLTTVPGRDIQLTGSYPGLKQECPHHTRHKHGTQPAYRDDHCRCTECEQAHRTFMRRHGPRS